MYCDFFLERACIGRRMRKIPTFLENPVDNLFYELAKVVSPALKATGHTPNALTTYSFGSGVLALIALSRDHVKTFATLWTLQSFWDCADGFYARKYGMVTPFGDAYDHVTDVGTSLGLLVLVHRKYDVPPLVMVAFGFFVACNAVFLGCQQKYASGRTGGKGGGESLDLLQSACPDMSWLPWTRWFAHGTFHILVVLVVLYCDKYHRRRPTPPA